MKFKRFFLKLRYVARLFGTKWFEYWPFLDDFADLSSEPGLAMLENYFLKENAPAVFYSDLRLQSNHSVPTSVNDSSSPFVYMDDDTPGTPISRQKTVDQVITSDDDRWGKHRAKSAPMILNDSLEDSSDASEPSIQCNESICEQTSKPNGVFSPIVGLLQRLTFSSPLRWLLVDGIGTGEPLFDPNSPIPSHKKPVRIRHPSDDVSTSPGKRKFRSPHRTSSPTSFTYRPATKKPSPSHRRSSTPSSNVFPRLYRQIYQALPSGDPEMDTAIAALSCSQRLNCAAPARQSWASCFRAPSLSRYQAVSVWQKQAHLALNAAQTKRNP